MFPVFARLVNNGIVDVVDVHFPLKCQFLACIEKVEGESSGRALWGSWEKASLQELNISAFCSDTATEGHLHEMIAI